MLVPASSINIPENTLRRKGDILEILLIDRTTGKNIIWGTDSYIALGKEFAPDRHIKSKLITGDYGNLIEPRAAKSIEAQRQRTRDKAEVFTPLHIVHKINGLVDRASGESLPASHSWQDYVSELRLEISCGEAPFIVSRYNPTAHTGHVIKIENRVGFLDHKLRVVSHYCSRSKEWIKWAKVAYQSSYGYEWQGDNILIARENLLYTLLDYYEAKFGRKPTLVVQREFAEIISWNIFQMDALKYVVPMSCHISRIITPGEITLFDEMPDSVEKLQCEGCRLNDPAAHNGKYVKIMDWISDKSLEFITLTHN